MPIRSSWPVSRSVASFPQVAMAAPSGTLPLLPTSQPLSQAPRWFGDIARAVGSFLGKLWNGVRRLFGEDSAPATYTVLSGDTLYGIAKKTLGDGHRWPEIYELNRDQLTDPNRIVPGMVLRLPAGSSKPANPPATPPSSGSSTVDIARGLNLPPTGINPSRAQLDTLFDRAADKYGIPPAILKAVALRESNWRQYDSNGQPVAGRNPSTTDWGIMQINDYWHPQAFPASKTDVAFNIDYGAKYLASQYRRYGDWRDAVAAYNRGSVQRDASGKYVNQAYVDFVFAHVPDFT